MNLERWNKPFTLENLNADGACEHGLEFVAPIIERGDDVALALKGHNGEWVQWAIDHNYNVKHLWCDMDDFGYSYTWDCGGKMSITTGLFATVTAGHRSAVTTGRFATVTTGYFSTVTTGYRSTVTTGYFSTVTTGYRSTVTTGHRSTVTTGHRSTVTAGYDSTVTAGYDSTVTAGYDSTVTTGYRSTVTAGYETTVTTGYDSVIVMYSIVNGVLKQCMAYVGDGGLKPDTPYTCISGRWVEVTE